MNEYMQDSLPITKSRKGDVPTLDLVRVLCCAKSLQLCLTLCDPMDYCPSESSVHGILQARILNWVSMPFSRGSSRNRDQTQASYVSYVGRWVVYH